MANALWKPSMVLWGNPEGQVLSWQALSYSSYLEWGWEDWFWVCETTHSMEVGVDVSEPRHGRSLGHWWDQECHQGHVCLWTCFLYEIQIHIYPFEVIAICVTLISSWTPFLTDACLLEWLWWKAQTLFNFLIWKDVLWVICSEWLVMSQASMKPYVHKWNSMFSIYHMDQTIQGFSFPHWVSYDFPPCKDRMGNTNWICSQTDRNSNQSWFYLLLGITLPFWVGDSGKMWLSAREQLIVDIIRYVTARTSPSLHILFLPTGYLA